MTKDKNIFMVRVPRAVEEPSRLTQSPMPPKPERKIKSAPTMRSKSPVKNKHLFYGRFKPVKPKRDVKDVSQLDFRNRSWSVCGGEDHNINRPTLYGHDYKRTEKLWNIQDVAISKKEIDNALPRRSFYNCHDLTLKRAGIDPKKIEQDVQKKVEAKTKKKTKKRRRKKSKQSKIAKENENNDSGEQSHVDEKVASKVVDKLKSLKSTTPSNTNTSDRHIDEVTAANAENKTIKPQYTDDTCDKPTETSTEIGSAAVSRSSSENSLTSSRIENEANKADDIDIQTLVSEQTTDERKRAIGEENTQSGISDKDGAIVNASSADEANDNATSDAKTTDITPRDSNKELELVIADIVRKAQAAQRMKTGKSRDLDFTVLLKYLLEVKRSPNDYWKTKHKLSSRNNSGTIVETYQTDIPTESLIVQAAYEVTLMSRMLNPETFRRRKAEAEAKTKSASGATVKVKDNRMNVDIPSTVAQEYSNKVEKYRAEVEQWLMTLTTIQMTTARDMALKVMGEKGRSDMDELIRRQKEQDKLEKTTTVF